MASLDSNFLSCCQVGLILRVQHLSSLIKVQKDLSVLCIEAAARACCWCHHYSSQHGANAEMVPSPREMARLRHHRARTPHSPLPPACRISSLLLREPSIILDGVTGQVNSKHVLCWEITEC
ncbi:hypothetical protein AOLI_G00157740 [Acnodon oligacanthus]